MMISKDNRDNVRDKNPQEYNGKQLYDTEFHEVHNNCMENMHVQLGREFILYIDQCLFIHTRALCVCVCVL